MKNALNNQVGMLGNMFLWLLANLKQGGIYFIKQGGGNHKIAWVYFSKLQTYWKIFPLAAIKEMGIKDIAIFNGTFSHNGNGKKYVN